MANGERYQRCGGRRNAVHVEKAKACKKPKKRADSPASGARCVGRRLTLAGKTFQPYFQKAFAAQNPSSSWDDTPWIDGNYRLPTTSATIAFLAGETGLVAPRALDAPEHLTMIHIVHRTARGVRCQLEPDHMPCERSSCFVFRRPTASVTRWWVGRDNAILTEPTSSHTNCLKTRRVPPVGC